MAADTTKHGPEMVRRIFATLHDGSITGWSGDKNRLILTIACPYLAERIDPSFSIFHIALQKIEQLQLTTWPKPVSLPARVLTMPEEIFGAELELLSAEMIDGAVIIACNQDDSRLDYCGGNLALTCAGIRIFDERFNALEPDYFFSVAKGYWEHFGHV